MFLEHPSAPLPPDEPKDNEKEATHARYRELQKREMDRQWDMLQDNLAQRVQEVKEIAEKDAAEAQKRESPDRSPEVAE